MNFGTMKTYLRTLLGENPDPAESFIGEQTAALFLNEAGNTVASEIQSLRTHYDGLTVPWDSVPDTDSKYDGRYPIANAFLSIKAAHVWVGTVQHQLTRLTYDEFESVYTGGQYGIPLHYRVEFGATSNEAGSAPGDIKFGPKPSGAYPFRVVQWRTPTPVSATGEDDRVMEIPEPFHKVVCFCAAMELSLVNDDHSRAQRLERRYEVGLVKAQSIVARQDRTGGISNRPAFARSKSWRRRAR
jgi:hypothetical protein